MERSLVVERESRIENVAQRRRSVPLLESGAGGDDASAGRHHGRGHDERRNGRADGSAGYEFGSSAADASVERFAAASADAALLKARTSLRIGAPTADLGPATADAPTRDAFLILQMTTLPGGIPLTDKAGNPIGAVGVSGGEAAQDAECARQAVEQRQLKKK